VGSPREAIACYQRVLRLDPGHAYARQQLARLQGSPSAAAPAQPPIPPPSVPPPAPAAPAIQSALPPAASGPAQTTGPAPKTPVSSTAPASRTSNLPVILGASLLGVSCLVLLAIALISPTGLSFGPPQPTPSSDELFNVLYQNARAANEENITAYMATIHPDSRSYDSTEAALVDIFAQYNLQFRFYNLELTSLKTNRAEIHFMLSTRKINGPDFRDNIVTGTMILRPDQGVWKIYNQEVEDIQY
jgi:hypothetical protein